MLATAFRHHQALGTDVDRSRWPCRTECSICPFRTSRHARQIRLQQLRLRSQMPRRSLCMEHLWLGSSWNSLQDTQTLARSLCILNKHLLKFLGASAVAKARHDKFVYRHRAEAQSLEKLHFSAVASEMSPMCLNAKISRPAFIREVSSRRASVSRACSVLSSASLARKQLCACASCDSTARTLCSLAFRDLVSRHRESVESS